MNMLSTDLKSLGKKLSETVRVRKGVVAVVAVVFVAQMYFVRELLAAELLFGLGFAVLLAFAGLFYVIGAISERGLDWTEAGVRAVADTARRGFSASRLRFAGRNQ